MAKTKSRTYCAVFGCMNSHITRPEITFFKLPGDPERRLQWLQLIRRDDLKDKPKFASYCVCEIHFNVKDILRSTNRRRLKKNALPLLMLSSTAPGVFYVDKETQTDPSVRSEKCTQTKNAMIEGVAQTSTSL